jgi:hypothetical protein
MTFPESHTLFLTGHSNLRAIEILKVRLPSDLQNLFFHQQHCGSQYFGNADLRVPPVGTDSHFKSVVQSQEDFTEGFVTLLTGIHNR